MGGMPISWAWRGTNVAKGVCVSFVDEVQTAVKDGFWSQDELYFAVFCSLRADS